MAHNTIIDCTGWDYPTFCNKRKEWEEAGFESNIEPGKSTIFAKESDVLAKFPELQNRILKPTELTYAKSMTNAIKKEKNHGRED